MLREYEPKAAAGEVLWDAFGLQTLHSGVGRHAWDLLMALNHRACQPKIIPSIPQLDPVFASQSLEAATSWPRSRLKPWSLFVAGRELSSYLGRSTRHCIVHGLSNYNLPSLRRKGLKKVLTVHDLIPLMHRREVSSALAAYLRWQMPRAIRSADAIICVSRWTEQCLHELFPESRQRTVVIPNGWPIAAQSESKAPAARITLLTVSRHEQYKRLAMIPAILSFCAKDIAWIVVTDSKGEEELKRYSMPQLTIKTQLSDQDLLDWHRQAQVYVHPSLWEGFCLPAASSISFAVPVIYTKGSGIDEVVGRAGRGISPDASPQFWAEAISELLADTDNKTLCLERSRAAASWDDVAAATLDLYGKLGGW